MNPRSHNRDRIAVVDLVRTLSILMVICAHLRYSQTCQATGLLDTVWRAATRNGAYGVTLFFLVSGFLITRMTAAREKNLFKPSLRAFYTRRIARIIPLFAAICLFGAVMLPMVNPALPAVAFCLKEPGVIFDWQFWAALGSFSFNWFRIVKDCSFGLHWDVCWSLAIEEQFYLLYPLVLAAMGEQRRMVKLLIGIVLLGPISRAMAYFWAPLNFLASFTNSFGAFDLIALGCLLYFARLYWKDRLRPNTSLLLCISGAALGLLVYGCTAILKSGIDRIFGPTIIGAALFLFLMGGLSLKRFDNLPRWLLWPGELSYGCYLLHASVLYFLWPILSKLNVLAGLPLFIVTTTAVAAVSFRVLEQPANRKIRQLLQPAKLVVAEAEGIQAHSDSAVQ